ncbi:MAG TPA: ABC transporter ATP-binding protein [Candidatus Dojkabacteria bacterium]|nr:ABC transporter ATP-binding protein [Candidatus Dojkabacteria bacterium]
MIKLFKYLKPYILHIIVLIGLTYVQVMASLRLPDYMSDIVNTGIIGQDMDFIWSTGLKMLGITAIGALCAVINGYLASRIGSGFSKTLRKDVFSKVESFSLAEFNQFSTASLITRSTNDIQQIQMVLIMAMRIVLAAPIMGIGAVQKAYSIAPSMTWIMAVAVGVLTALIIFLFVFAVPKFELMQKLIDKLNLFTRQNLTGVRVIRAFNRQGYEAENFDEINKGVSKVHLFVNRVLGIMQPVMMLVFNMTSVLIVWVGAHLVEENSLFIGDIMAFMQYAMQVIMSFLMISVIFIIVPRASVSIKRISEVLNTKLSILDPKNPKKPKGKAKGLVEFKNVTFKYPDADVPVLYNISFTAKPGETTAIIGGTGSGKSTVVNLIPRFFDVTSGQLLIDGINVKDVRQKDLRKRIGYIPQKGVLFSGTVESNIKYGNPNASNKEMERAARISQSIEFISKLEEKYNYPIAQGGTNVSGGQKQRLSIARALLINPDIYIFDDSFSALDFKTAAKLSQDLRKETKDATVIIVAQRIGMTINADKVIVLDEGRVVGVGKHKELLKTCKVYREIALSQLSQEEIEENG